MTSVYEPEPRDVSPMTRIDLYVSPEEYAAVEALGARWDDQLKCWYIERASQEEHFARWLADAPNVPNAPPDAVLNICSNRAFIASARTRCYACGRGTEVVCLYCRSGTAWAQPLERFTVQDIRAVDAALARQLERWPRFHADAHLGGYVNHCTHCGTALPDAQLHSEPDHPFHEVSAYDGVRNGPVVLTALPGAVRVSGDYSVAV
jgi:hypothetical protein